MKRILPIIACAALLTGCVSVPMTSQTQDAEAKKFVPEAGKASAYLYLQGGDVGGLLGDGSPPVVQTLFDGLIVGSLAPKTYHWLSVDPGEHVLSPAGNVENVELVKFKAEEGKNYFFRVAFGMGWVKGRIHIKQVSEEEGRKAVTSRNRAEAIK